MSSPDRGESDNRGRERARKPSALRATMANDMRDCVRGQQGECSSA
jgi:hypothetical protein